MHPVGERELDHCGLHDMLGYAQEWTSSHRKDWTGYPGYGLDALLDPDSDFVKHRNDNAEIAKCEWGEWSRWFERDRVRPRCVRVMGIGRADGLALLG